MSMTVAIRPVSLWMHAMFGVLAVLERSGLCIVDLTRDSRADMLRRIQAVAEFAGCLARGAVAACATLRGGLDARVVGCVIRRMGWHRVHDLGHLPRAGGVFPPDWLSIVSSRRRCMASTISFDSFARDNPGVLRRDKSS